MTRWSPGRLYGRARAPRGLGREATRTAADDVATDRLPTQAATQRPSPPRPRTAPLPALPGERGRGPDRWTQRAGELLDQHLHGLLPRDRLIALLGREVWWRTGPRRPITDWIDQLDTALHRHADHLRAEADRYARVAADAERCPQCPPHRTCPMHLKQLRRWWDVLHPIAATVAHPPTRAAP